MQRVFVSLFVSIIGRQEKTFPYLSLKFYYKDFTQVFISASGCSGSWALSSWRLEPKA